MHFRCGDEMPVTISTLAHGEVTHSVDLADLAVSSSVLRETPARELATTCVTSAQTGNLDPLIRLVRALTAGAEYPRALAVAQQAISAGMRHRFPARFHWDGAAAPDDVLLLVAGSGFGDSIWWARFIPEAMQRVGHVVLQVDA